MNEVFKIGNEMIVFDPNPEAISFLKKANPDFEIESAKPSNGFIPNFQMSNDTGVLEERLHKALRMLYRCELCAWECKVNRFEQKGRCGLTDKIQYFSPFVHIAEEPVINPAILVNFTKCSMNCVYCVRHNQSKGEAFAFDIEAFWNRIEDLLITNPNVCSLEFAGGDPTLYLPWILTWMNCAPDDFNLPVVWNSNLFVNSQTLNLLDGVVDVYLPDFSFGNDECAKRFSGVDEYMIHARKGIELIINQKARVIVRILVLPGHVDCCNKRSLEWLSQYKDKIWISTLDQYIPAHKASKYKEIYRRPSRKEISEVEEFVAEKGFRNILDQEDFWKF